MKFCNKCKTKKPFDEFTKDKKIVDGLSRYCRECEKKYRKAYREKNREKLNAHQRKFAQSEKGKKYQKEYMEKYVKENREKLNAYHRERWDKDYGEKTRQKRREKYHSDLENERKKVRERYYRNMSDPLFVAKKNARWNRWKAKDNGLLNNLTGEEWESILKHFNYSCVITGKSDYVTFEHFIPIDIGHGGTIIENCYPMDFYLNSSKGDKNPFEWAKNHPEVDQFNFYKLVQYLADLNGLTVDEYRDYVYWCFENPRDPNQINKENQNSILIWKGCIM